MAALAPLVARTYSIWTVCEEARILQHTLFASLHSEEHSVRDTDPVVDAVNAYLDWV